MTREIWKPIPIEEICYHEASNNGAIRDENGIERKQYLSRYGYFQCSLRCKNGKFKNFRVNRLVASAFFGIQNGLVVNHKDGNKQNNSVNNLEWCSQKENCNDINHIENLKVAATIKNAKRKTIRKYSLNGEFIAEYISARQAAKENNIFVQNISLCCLGKIRQSGGFYMEICNMKTREEEIKQAYLDWASDIECSEYTVWKDAVEWADKHPKNLWISVEKHPDDVTKDYLLEYEDGTHIIAMWDSGKWMSKNLHPLKEPIRWMPIPEHKKGE